MNILLVVSMVGKSFCLIAFRNLAVKIRMRWLGGGGWGLGREVFISSWGDLGGFAVVQGLVQVTHMIRWCAANQTFLVLTGRGSHAGSLSFLVRSLGGVSMQGFLMEWSSWIHIEGLTFEQTRHVD